MDWPALAVVHVVTKSFAPKLAALADAAAKSGSAPYDMTATGTPETASNGLPCMSCTAPAGTARLRDAAPDILARSPSPRVAAAVSWDVTEPRNSSVSPPCVTFIGMSFAVIPSVNCTNTVPLTAWYVAFSTVGFVVSRTDTVLFPDAPMGLPAASVTAPRSTSNDIVWDWANRSRPVWFRTSVTASRDIVVSAERRTVLAPSVSMILEPSAVAMPSVNRTDTAPSPVLYVAFRNAGGTPSRMATLLLLVAALGYPPALMTAPSPTRTAKDAAPASRFLSASVSARCTAPPDTVELPVGYAV